MKNIIILLILSIITIFFISCKTVEYKDFNVIKYKKFNTVRYDWYNTYSTDGNYLRYIKYNHGGHVTNYIFGDFEIIKYSKAIKEIK